MQFVIFLFVFFLVSKIDDFSKEEQNVMKIKYNKDENVITVLQSLREDGDVDGIKNFENISRSALISRGDAQPQNINELKKTCCQRYEKPDTLKIYHQEHQNFGRKKVSKVAKVQESDLTFNFTRSLQKPNLQQLAKQPTIDEEQNFEDSQNSDHESLNLPTDSRDNCFLSISQIQHCDNYLHLKPLSVGNDSSSDIIERYIAEQQKLSEAKLLDKVDEKDLVIDYDLLQPKRQQNKRAKKRKKRHKINPSHQLNTISSIQVS